MKKKYLIIFAAVLIACSLLAASACEKTQESEDVAELSYWMSYIKDDAPITDIAIPGTHDSGTLGMISVCETQNKDFAGQLATGARYFDVRVRDKGDEMVFYHTLSSSNTYKAFLEDIEEFLTANPTEFLILDYQHRDPAGDKEFDNKLFSMLLEKLGKERIVCAPEGMSNIDYVNSLTLGDVRGKVLAVLGDEKGVTDYSFVMVRDADASAREGSVLHSPYVGKYNKSDSEEYVNNYLDEYISMYSQYDGGICVLQGQLTGGVLEDKEAKHDPNMSAWIRALKDDGERLSKINVIMRDYITSQKSMDIIELNIYKGYVKDSLINEFNEIVEKLA